MIPPPKMASSPQTYDHVLLDRHRLSDQTFELRLGRPAAFQFSPGQRIRIVQKGIERDYSMVSSPKDPDIHLCVRETKGGRLSPWLATASIGTPIRFSGPHGYFTFHPSERPPVFVATGTGIAPFVSMCRAGVKGFTLLHGVQKAEDLYYKTLFQGSAHPYVPCLTGADGDRTAGAYPGRVTEFMESRLAAGRYDFYVSGAQEMIRDVLRLVDNRFPDSFIFTEPFI
jgi:ferredoxin-NADP reductase